MMIRNARHRFGCLLAGAAIAMAAVVLQPRLLAAQPMQACPPDQFSASRGCYLAWLAQRPVGLQLHEAPGVATAVAAVQAGGTAELAGLKLGDLLLRVGSLQAPTPAAAAARIENAWAAGKTAIALVVVRAGIELYVPLRLQP